jgi:hypothetical protein
MNKIIKYSLYSSAVGLGAYFIIDYLNTKSEVNKLKGQISFRSKPHDAILINFNSGEILDHTFEKYGAIYFTNENNSYSGWRNCYLLRHALTPNEKHQSVHKFVKNSIVFWSDLNDLTKEFNDILFKWIIHFHKRRSWDYYKKLRYWRGMVTDHAPLDIKRNIFSIKKTGEYSKYENHVLRYDDFGNILFGAAGTAFGISRDMLQLGANLNQLTKTGLDDIKDTFSIDVGVNLYKERFESSLESYNQLYLDQKIA